jgi:hypothetical protein
MADTHLVGTNGRIDFTLEGLTFRRTKSAAEARGVGRVHTVGWADINEATIVRSGKGRSVVQIQVSDAATSADRRSDPHAMKVKRSMDDDAREFVAMVNHEVATRRRWDAAAAKGA